MMNVGDSVSHARSIDDGVRPPSSTVSISGIAGEVGMRMYYVKFQCGPEATLFAQTAPTTDVKPIDASLSLSSIRLSI